MRKIYLCYCEDCDEYFTGEERVHQMYHCPSCLKTGVDIDKYYTRLLGDVKIIKRITIPKEVNR